MDNMKELLSQTNQLSAQISKEYPDFVKGLVGFGKAAEGGPSLDTKTVELIAIACSVVRQCDYCIAFHVNAAIEAGATRDEMMEAAFVACLMGGGPAWMYAKLVRKAIDDLQS
jgi:AhpD family alkylhydroperoxidase